jgi:hypothetical protein
MNKYTIALLPGDGTGLRTLKGTPYALVIRPLAF